MGRFKEKQMEQTELAFTKDVLKLLEKQLEILIDENKILREIIKKQTEIINIQDKIIKNDEKMLNMCHKFTGDYEKNIKGGKNG